MSPLLQSARFSISVAQWHQLPNAGLPEVAFVGRSNAGKSTLVNKLCQQRRQAFASKTPGRTRLLNFFAVGLRGESLGYLVDLPGYGFASVAQEQMRHWDELLTRYLTEHEALRGLVLLVDIRRGLGDLDQQLLAMLGRTHTPICIALTKSDKLTRTAARVALAQLRHAYPPSPECSSLICSSQTREGLDELSSQVESWLCPGASGAPASIVKD